MYNSFAPNSAQLNYNNPSNIGLQQRTPNLQPQTSINLNMAPPPPQRQVSIAVSNPVGVPQPPVHNYGISNSNGMMANSRTVIYQGTDLQKQVLLSQPSPRQLSQMYQMNRQMQPNSINENANVVGSYTQTNSSNSSVPYNRTASLPLPNLYDIQYTQTIRNPNPLPPNQQDSTSTQLQFNPTNSNTRRESLSNPITSNYNTSASAATTEITTSSAQSHPLPSPQTSNYQQTTTGYKQGGNTLPSPISSAQNQITQGRPLPSNPQTSQQTTPSSTVNNRMSTYQINTNNMYYQSNTTTAAPTSNTTPPLSAPVRVTSMMAKPGQQFIYRNQTVMNGPSQMPLYKSFSTTQLSSQQFYPSPMSQPTSASVYIPNTQYLANGKISPSMKPQSQYSPQMVANNRNGASDDSLSSSFEGPSIPPRKVKPRYSTSSTYYSSPSLTGMSYSPRLHGFKNESEYENFRNNRPMSMISTSSENIVELPKRISSNKSSSVSGFGYRNNSRSSICSAPDLHNSFYNSNVDINIPEGAEVNNYPFNSNNSQGKYKYSRSIHGYSVDDTSSEFNEHGGNLRSQYGSTNSLNNLLKYDHMKIENMFMDDEVYQIGDLRDKYPLIDHSPLLSEIASDFSETISLVRHIKDNIEYLDCFSGYEAVSLLAEILGTEDRKVALQTGQVLEAYGMFHDVVYMHKLMDNKDHFYQMHTLALPLARVVTLSRPNYRHDMAVNNVTTSDVDLQIKNMSELSFSTSTTAATTEEKKEKEENKDDNKIPFPTGVLVGIAQCYSPTCFEDSPCYSYSCPKRRLYERVNNKKVSLDHIKTTINANLPFQTTWSTSIGKPYVKKMEKKEIKRQEIIYEFIQTEKEYIDDLYTVITKIMEPIAEGRVSKVGEEFVHSVFSNFEELFEVNKNFYNNIHELQKRKPILESIGDIVKDFIPHLHCYEYYGRSQPRAKHILQIERSHNKSLNNFFKGAQYEPEFRRLPIESFLARPTTRLGRYPILLKNIIKNTPEGHRDIILLTDALHGIENILKEVNNQAGKATNKLKLEEWSLLLESERKDDISLLRLENPEREFIREGKLELKRYANEAQNHSFIPVTLVLLDNMLVITKPKVNSIEIYKKPIPLQLLSIAVDENSEQGVEIQVKHKRGSKNENRKYYTFTIIHQGVATYLFQTMVYSDQKAWVECIKDQLSKYKTESIVKVVPLITNPGTRIIAANYISSMLFLLATENGIYIQSDNKMKLVLPLSKISHMEVMLQYKLLFIISSKLKKKKKKLYIIILYIYYIMNLVT